jgi:putative restriction endonuclease
VPALSPELAAELTSNVHLRISWQHPLRPWGVLAGGPHGAGRLLTGRTLPSGVGHIEGIPVGAWFADRGALQEATIHRPGEAGICGRQHTGAESIVVSGGYPEDEDYGDLIVYTGQGGYDRRGGPQVRNQLIARGNAALVTSYVNETPARVIRGSGGDPAYSPDSGFRYDGLFKVERFWSEPGRSGFLVWRYQLRRLEDLDAVPGLGAVPVEASLPDSRPEGNGRPGRRAAVTQRVVRSTAVAEWVKRAHGNSCQICGEELSTPRGTYAEAAHIRPLGRPHDGPDRPENILCLCANHHILFDYGAIWVAETGAVISHRGRSLGRLRLAPSHEVADEHLGYHRAIIARQPSTESGPNAS